MPVDTKSHNAEVVPQIKICGLTRVDEALQCAQLGADAVGLVFYPKSPRFVNHEQARGIAQALPSRVKKVGVFVNESVETVLETAGRCRLDAVQLHGQESPETVRRLRRENLIVIKALFAERNPSLEDAESYAASAFLVECGKGVLPGGNALEWNWAITRTFSENHLLILAGGLSPDNVESAVQAGRPDAVDVSSGVESAPGRKDPAKVEAFIRAVSRCVTEKKIRRIFNA